MTALDSLIHSSNDRSIYAPDLHGFYSALSEKLTLDQYRETKARLAARFSAHPQQLAQLDATVYGSQYAAECFIAEPELLYFTLAQNHIDSELSLEHYSNALQEALKNADTFDELDRQLRLFRRHCMLRIIWRDFNRTATTMQTTMELSWLAEVCLKAALDFHYRQLVMEHGEPKDAEGQVQPFLILGMGKLGAWELNLSSDIDLIFTYPNPGSAANGKITNQEFFSLLGKRIIQSLDKLTADGIVFRVDMRLRPYGQSGALVSSFDALEDYYQTQGREWERYAMVKARVVASNGKPSHTARLMAMLRSFTYRRYVDFSVIDALRKLKQMINQEVKRRRLSDDIKLGQGGIREIEFIAQVFQLIRGGRDTELQDNRLLHILPLLERMNCLPKSVAVRLMDAYCFLRNTEHALQGYKCEQTQKLPKDEAARQRVARIMGFVDWSGFYAELEEHRQLVQQEFEAVIASAEDKQNHEFSVSSDWQSVWHKTLNEKDIAGLLGKHGFQQVEQTLDLLEELRQSPAVLNMQSSTRVRLDDFMPLLLAAVSGTPSPTETLARIVKLVKSIARRSAYLLLLTENPRALDQLVKLTLASPWIANELAEHPALLDELLDPRTLYHPPDKAELQDDLRRSMLRVPLDDLEAQMEALRYFRSAHALRVAACEITDALPLMKVSDYLTFLAEAILEYVLVLAWNEMVARHGYPDGEMRETPNFIIVAYGKLGGIELGHGSDLDLVFIHNANPTGTTAFTESGDGEGKRNLDNQVFYMRLGQKVIHILNTKTPSGQLYEVDMRLRPSGNSGMLVTTLNAFEKYQRESAWTWEHQALVRARVVAGDTSLAREFAQVRKDILCRQRDLDKLRDDVVEMRLKMRQHLGSDKTGDGSHAFDIKQDPGGIVDIEFMVQYAVLAWAHAETALVTYTDNIRILESLEHANLLSTQEVAQLIEAYKAYRSMGHSLTLQQQPNIVDGDPLVTHRKAVTHIWEKLLGKPGDQAPASET